MVHKRTPILVGLLTLIVLASGRYAQVQVASANCQFNQRSLLTASLSDVEQQARDYACARLQGVGSLQTLLNRSITPSEALSLFPTTGTFCRDQKLALVVLKGDFVQEVGFLKERPHFAYVVLVMDLKRGAPTIISARPHGEGLGTILKDPVYPTEVPQSIPEIGPDVISKLNLPAPLQPLGVLRECLPDDYVAPTARPPTRLPNK
ncbi:MAG: hypothetical protein HY782_23525 [Chloroflexi bacterium]|nr:hypothetical protein [Chloroflexota bacterium]